MLDDNDGANWQKKQQRKLVFQAWRILFYKATATEFPQLVDNNQIEIFM
jgi:hypothetical protein